jgi:hypothetical protein
MTAVIVYLGVDVDSKAEYSNVKCGMVIVKNVDIVMEIANI